MRKIVTTSLLSSAILSCAVQAEKVPESAANRFIEKMVNEHQFEKQSLTTLFKSVEIKPSIIKAITRPAEGMPWHKYRKIFLGDERINEGVKFWHKHKTTLAAVSEKYGIPEEVMVAIIGVETLYGQRTGGYRVIDALSTLGFTYPKRSEFFLSELKHFLILSREEKMNPLDPVGSYAGAMGIPQFMPSSYRSYAADFEGDAKRDIWQNPADAIASVAYYFARHHWIKDQPIVYKAAVVGKKYKQALTKGLKPDLKVGQLKALGLQLKVNLPADTAVKVLSFEQETQDDIWVALTNFYVITRYNHSPLYAMAVFQLSEAIKARYAD